MMKTIWNSIQMRQSLNITELYPWLIFFLSLFPHILSLDYRLKFFTENISIYPNYISFASIWFSNALLSHCFASRVVTKLTNPQKLNYFFVTLMTFRLFCMPFEGYIYKTLDIRRKCLSQSVSVFQSASVCLSARQSWVHSTQSQVICFYFAYCRH